jgi:tRNA1(Val) A37 N6-methylase TrmN6
MGLNKKIKLADKKIEEVDTNAKKELTENQVLNNKQLLSNITKDYYKIATIEHRKENGQYMTPFDIIDESLKIIKIKEFESILEPSCGTGQFIEKISLQNKKAKIVGIELDKAIYDYIKDSFSKNVTIMKDDFLLKDFGQTKYDLIIGNPPYFEIDKKKTPYTNIIKSNSDVLLGRINIYTLFIKKSIDLLETSGVLLFVIPTSLLSSKYFEKIRSYIVDKCRILNIRILNSNDFEDALQQTMIFVLEKLNVGEKNDGKFIIKLGNTIIFNESYEKYNEEIKNKKFIKDYKCKVKTGSIVWNQHKDSLTNEKKDNIMLVYPRNLNSKKNKLDPSDHDKKMQYINSKKYTKHAITGPIIAINRIIGIKDITLNPVLIDDDDKYYFENHINTIEGDIKDLQLIYNSLKKPETIDFIKNIIGNTQLSKTELETMVPV